MTEQPTPQEPSPTPSRPMPRLGKGVRWGAHLDSPIPPTEPYKPKPRTRPAGGWPKTGNVGASTQLGEDEQPVTVPAQPYDDEFPPAAELRAMADDLNAHGGLDEKFVAELLRQAAEVPEPADPLARARQQLGIGPAVPCRSKLVPVTPFAGEPSVSEKAMLRAAADEVVAKTAPYGPKAEFGVARPTKHQHVWSGSPMRCVDCSRHLRPWWRRILDRTPLWMRLR